MTLVKQAALFAYRAHAQQKRKYTGEPYFNHCDEVARIVSSVTDNPHMIAAAYLHDTVEDTDVTIDIILKVFGVPVAKLVWELTDKSRPEDGNRAKRKQIDREFLLAASSDAKTIKCADLISNTKSIVERDPKFAKVYLAEKRMLMPCLAGANAKIWHEANVLAGGS